MSLILKLTRKGLRPEILRYNKCDWFNFTRSVSLKCTPYISPNDETHDERNMRLRRPQSPHLSIYKPQLTTMLSISHRATGMILSFYVIAFSMVAVYLGCPIEYYIEQLKCAEVGRACIFGIKFAIAFPFTYHLWNGVRHLFWDAGMFLTIKQVYATGWVMLMLSVASALALSGYPY